MLDLDKISQRFINAYNRKTKALESLERQQTRLFTAFNEQIANRTLRRERVKYEGEIDKVTDWVKTYYPAYRWTGVLDHGWAVLEEDPAFIKFTYTHPSSGKTFGRTIAQGGPSLDDERLQQADIELWERITTWPEPWWSLVRDTIKSMTSMRWNDNALDSAADRIMREKNVKRVLRDLNDLSTSDLASVQEYLVPGRLTPRLIPPRNATAEELESVNH